MGADDPRKLAVANAAMADGRGPNLLIVSDVRLFSEGLTEALKGSPILSMVDYCANWPEAQAKLPTCRPDIVLLDASIPDGLCLVRNIRQFAPEVLLVVLALTDTAESVVSWAEAGVSGYIPKTAGLADVLPTLLGIQRGEQVCSPSVAAGLLRRVQEISVGDGLRSEQKPLPTLTSREAQIIELISFGFSNKEIARRLNIGVATTKSHVHNLFGKLNLQRRSQAAVWMREHRTR